MMSTSNKIDIKLGAGIDDDILTKNIADTTSIGLPSFGPLIRISPEKIAEKERSIRIWYIRTR